MPVKAGHFTQPTLHNDSCQSVWGLTAEGWGQALESPEHWAQEGWGGHPASWAPERQVTLLWLWPSDAGCPDWYLGCSVSARHREGPPGAPLHVGYLNEAAAWTQGVRKREGPQ